MKRVVGLPGESMRIVDGDVFVDGQIVRKTLAEQRAMRILVHDSRYRAAGLRPVPPLGFRVRMGLPIAGAAAGRGRRADSCTRRPSRAPGPSDWLDLPALGPGRRRYGPVRDFYAYNGGELPAENEVADLGLEARLIRSATRSTPSRRPCGPGRTGSWCGSRSGPGGEIELVRNGSGSA